VSRSVHPHTTAAPDPRRPSRQWNEALDQLADAVTHLTLDRLDRYAATVGANDVAALSEATMVACVRVASTAALDAWLCSTPVSRGGLVLDPPPPRQAAA
jgi:hypothetical protein